MDDTLVPPLTSEGCYDVEPTTNVKCIVFTFLILFVWILPVNKWILLPLLYFPYLILAWYDKVYKCKRVLGPTYLGLFYAKFKPQESSQIKIYKNWCPKQRWKTRIVDISILIIVLILFFVFYIRPMMMQKK
jgi:hypothetical protein